MGVREGGVWGGGKKYDSYMRFLTQLPRRGVVSCSGSCLYLFRCGKHSVKNKAAFIEISLSIQLLIHICLPFHLLLSSSACLFGI